MPYRLDSFDRCPRCQVSLEPLRLATMHEIRSCEQCNGNWIANEDFRLVVEALAPGAKVDIAPRDDDEPIIACPVCHRPMDKLGVHGVPLERCGTHGMWLDWGELQGVLTAAYDRGRR